jgi:hypothetical protein
MIEMYALIPLSKDLVIETLSNNAALTKFEGEFMNKFYPHSLVVLLLL